MSAKKTMLSSQPGAKAMLSSQPGAKDNSDTNSVPICVIQMSAKKAMLSSQPGALEAATPMPVTTASRMSARMFSKMIVTGSLMPVAQRSELETRLGKFEVLSAIVDSGATVPVMNPTTGARYDVLLGSANGTEYEIASGDTLEDLGEKRMAVLTAEGTLRGYGSRCAEVTKALQSVRALVGSGHAVCFGLGDGSEHVIINKITGETNCLRDDGVNYLQDLLIVPPEDIERVAAELAAVAASRNWTSDESVSASFGRQGS